MNSIDKELVRRLVKLSPLSTRVIAEKCEMSQPNLVVALAGIKRELPKAKLPLLLDLLGIPNGKPAYDRVHFWNVGLELDNLQYAVSKFFPNGAELAALWRQGGGPWDITRIADHVMLAIYDEKCRVIVRRSNLGALLPLAKMIEPKTVPGLHWRVGGVGADAMVSIPKDRYLDWEKGASVTVAEFDDVMGSAQQINWQQVLDYMQRAGLTPAEALSMVQKYQGQS